METAISGKSRASDGCFTALAGLHNIVPSVVSHPRPFLSFTSSPDATGTAMADPSQALPPSLDLPPHLSAHKYFFVCTLTVAAWDTLVLSPRSWRLLKTKGWPFLKIAYHFLRVFMPVEFTIVGVAFFDTQWTLDVSHQFASEALASFPRSPGCRATFYCTAEPLDIGASESSMSSRAASTRCRAWQARFSAYQHQHSKHPCMGVDCRTDVPVLSRDARTFSSSNPFAPLSSSPSALPSMSFVSTPSMTSREAFSRSCRRCSHSK